MLLLLLLAELALLLLLELLVVMKLLVLMLKLLLTLLVLMRLVVQKHIIGGNGLHNVMHGVVGVLTVSILLVLHQGGVYTGGLADVCLLVVPQEIVQGGEQLAAARVVLAVVCLQVGQVRCRWWRLRH